LSFEEKYHMRRDQQLVFRILETIESWPPGGPRSIELPGVDPQVLLEHIAMLEHDGLIRATVHRAGGQVDSAVIRDLEMPGRHELSKLRASSRPSEQGKADLTRLKTLRDRVIRYVYEHGAGQYAWAVKRDQVKQALGITEHELRQVYMMMLEQGLTPDHGALDAVGLSQRGQEEAERLGTIVEISGVEATAGAGDLTTDILQVGLTDENRISGATASTLRTVGRSNRVVVVLQIETLLLLVRGEIHARREGRLNDDDELRHLEEIESEAEKLRTANHEVESGIASPASELKAARSFGEVVRKWLESDQALEVATGSCKVAIFLLSTSICASLGVLPTAAAAISGALVGGKAVVDAIKAARSQKD
jgi:hypothetical protein